MTNSVKRNDPGLHAAWMSIPRPNATDVALYNVIRGIRGSVSLEHAFSRVRRYGLASFTPLVNEVRIRNNYRGNPFYAENQAVDSAVTEIAECYGYVLLTQNLPRFINPVLAFFFDNANYDEFQYLQAITATLAEAQLSAI